MLIIAALSITGCGEQVGDHIPASAVARNGFFRDPGAVAQASGRDIKLWGFVDHGNLYGDADAKKILQEWWSGVGPSADTWRFNLKAEANDAVGHGEPTTAPVRIADILTWLAVLSAVGIVNAVVVYGAASIFPPNFRTPPAEAHIHRAAIRTFARILIRPHEGRLQDGR